VNSIIAKTSLKETNFYKFRRNYGIRVGEGLSRREKRLIEGNTNGRHLKKLTCKGALRQVFEPSIPSPLHTVYMYTVNLFTQGRGGGRVEPERRLEGQQFTKVGQKYQHDLMYLQSINNDKHLPQSPFTGQVFYDDILLWCLFS
jgi:hypothetical protein